MKNVLCSNLISIMCIIIEKTLSAIFKCSRIFEMEEPLRGKALHFSKRIYYNASKGNLWSRTPKGPKINVKSSAMIPQFKIDSSITDLINT